MHSHPDNRMALQNIQNQDMSLVLSSDAKPRLKWTTELHQQFIDAVAQLGGADKATPKSLMRVMGIHGLTLYHLKSHLQKYRLGKSQQSQTCIDNDQEYEENQRSQASRDNSDGNQNQIDESLQIAEALQMQMVVQRKLHEQIEVQRHLQLRIEAQGKYLQSVLKKAQDTLSGYNSSSVEVELAKAELSQLVSMVDTGCPSSQLVSMVDNGCPSSCLSVLTEIKDSSLKDSENKSLRGTRCSLETSLTSSESSGRKEDGQRKHEFTDSTNKWNSNSAVLSLTEMHPENKSESTERATARKRSGSTISDGNYVEQPSRKRSTTQKSGDQFKRFDLNTMLSNHLGTFDLNTHYLNDLDSDPKAIDLNRKEVEQFNEHL